jgi:hypothetical protein
MRPFLDALPEAPSLLAPQGEPTKQERPTDKDGGPIEALSTCRWCGGMHPTACPFIKIAEWHPTGQLARVVLKERVELEKAILYPFEEDEGELDVMRRALTAIKEGLPPERAQELAGTLLQMLEPAK